MKRITIFLLSLFLLSGCASLVQLAVGNRGLQIPQIVAYLEPVLRENQITVSGKIVIQNPTQSALGLETIHLAVKDENDLLVGTAVLPWEKPLVRPGEEIESPVQMNLSLSALDKKSLTIFLKTAFTYNAFKMRIPVESKIAVLSLNVLRETIARPLTVDIYTKLRSNLIGRTAVDYELRIINPFSIDLVLEDGIIRIFTESGADIAISRLPRTLFKESESARLTGSITIGNILGKLIRSEIAKHKGLRFRFSGELRVPDTAIAMPFKIESIQEVDFSWLARKGRPN